jgi:hypothetical protein
MNLNILLGLIGILVSIGVGFGTFYVADRRSRRNRWQNAKDMVLRDLSKSLGEGSVPNASVIKATTRSILRSHNSNDMSVVTFDEIIDDLIRQITADPFLESDRRKQLQRDVLDLKEANIKLEQTMSSEEKKAEAVTIETRDKIFAWSTITSLLLGIIGSVVAATGLASMKPLLELIKNTVSSGDLKIGAAILAAIVTVIISIISILFSRHDKKD